MMVFHRILKCNTSSYKNELLNEQLGVANFATENVAKIAKCKLAIKNWEFINFIVKDSFSKLKIASLATSG